MDLKAAAIGAVTVGTVTVVARSDSKDFLPA